MFSKLQLLINVPGWTPQAKKVLQKYTEVNTPKSTFKYFSSATSGENAFFSLLIYCCFLSLPYQMNRIMHQSPCVSNIESQRQRQDDVTSTIFKIIFSSLISCNQPLLLSTSCQSHHFKRYVHQAHLFINIYRNVGDDYTSFGLGSFLNYCFIDIIRPNSIQAD